jgi:hypothetical protein
MPTIRGTDTNFYHKSDFTGSVVLNVPTNAVVVAQPGRMSVEVDFDDIRILMLAYFRQQMIKNITEMNADELESFIVFGGHEHEFELPKLGM